MRSTSTKAALVGLATAAIAFAVTASAPAGVSLNTQGWASHLSSRQVSALSHGPTSRVIVLMRDQSSALHGAGQAPVVAQLQQLHVPRLVTYRTLNAIATTVTAAEKANLLRNPAVLAVDPDVAVKGPSSRAPVDAPVVASRSFARRAVRATASSYKTCGTASAPLLEPEALHLINADNRTNANAPVTSGPPSAHSLGYDGSGVSVAVFPDGMDPNLPDFQRQSGSAVTDYQDFTGEGTAAVTGGGEAFGDVASIVAQGHQTYNLNQEINPDFTGPGACDVKVLGVAPGANVDVMKVFGTTNIAFTSVILQGIDYAIQTDHVNILSISIGFFGVPSSAAEQPLTQILENAMKNGTTVVASTGDSGPTNTETVPALIPGVIGAAASTSYRLLAQTNLFLYDMGQAIKSKSGNPSYQLGQGTPGWLSNQVSTLSSSGVTEDGRLPDILAPGDLNWAVCSTDIATYTDCSNAYGGQNIGLIDFGGTSESAPLTAGTAALVIEAFRKGHHGKTPSADVVRQILLSSASDIGIAASEQGAGLLNALRAVQLAKTYGKTGADGGLVFSQSSISDVASPGITHVQKVTVTNTGTSPAVVAPELRTLGRAKTIAHGSATLHEAAGAGVQGTCAGIDQAEYFNADTISEMNCVTFTVPKGVDELDSRIAWNPLQPCPTCTTGDPTVREILIDPNGRYGQYSDPQGLGSGFADEQIHQPAAGKWTLLIFGRETSPYEGPVSFMETAQKFITVSDAVSPSAGIILPGRSATFDVSLKAPSQPGFFTGAVVFPSASKFKGAGTAAGTLPVSMEARIPVNTKNPGHFTGTLIGGNARPGIYAQQLSYRFVVPKGVHDIDINLTTADDGYMLLGQLVDPGGHAVDNQLSFQQVTSQGDNANTHAVELVWANPQSGTWRINVSNGLFYLPGLATYSGLTQSTLHGTVSFNTAKVAVTGLPKGSHASGSQITTHIKVTNTGSEPETYQLDPRLVGSSLYAAQSLTNTDGTLPVTGSDTIPQYVVPPFSKKLQLTASTNGATPIMFDVSPYWGAPDALSAPSTNGATGVTVHDPFASVWAAAVSEIGPFASIATPENYSVAGALTTRGFDDNAAVSTGNIWSAIVDGSNSSLNPLFLLPGQSGTMTVTFTVNGTKGTKVHGVIPVETFDFNSLSTGIGDFSSDVLKMIPYSYTIK